MAAAPEGAAPEAGAEAAEAAGAGAGDAGGEAAQDEQAPTHEGGEALPHIPTREAPEQDEHEPTLMKKKCVSATYGVC